ncbi:hypothetical protein [Halomonas koreensis]|uniref:Uncharacterized protein n=1 Tax=Halomonas koreensis TaxID=245385 RepID=A0ABU1G401_9GAMM|nr:hypothetical protein [Halomonas koreensis]MDR5867406.1 hypothetical protein [Halomonas koreensis]
MAACLVTPPSLAADRGTNFTWLDPGLKEIRDRLPDPESVRFHDLYFHSGTGLLPYICGEVVYRDAPGEAFRRQRFVSYGEPHMVFLEDEVGSFASIWGAVCH